MHDRAYCFAGRPVTMRATGDELADLLHRCFEVQASPRADQPCLTVHAWDRAATGVGCPGIPHAPDTTDVLGPGLLHQYDGGRVVRYDRPDDVKVLDRASGELFFWVDDARRAGLSDRCKPFPDILATWYLDHGVHVLHAGLVARSGVGVLVGGAAGSGKSTTSLACGLAGFDVLGDDAVGTEITDAGCLGHSCYSSVRFDDGTLRRLPQLAAHSHPPADAGDRGKHLAHLTELLGRRPARTVSIGAIVVPTVCGSGPTGVVAARGAETLRRLAPSTLLRGLGAGVAGMAHMGELVRRVPCYELRLGDAVDDIPRALDDLLAGLPS